MNEPAGNEFGRLLTQVVPPLPAPADRVGEVGQRVRRARWRAAAAGLAATAAVVAVAAMAVPQLTADRPDPTSATPADCPIWTQQGSEDALGPLVPSGAVDATLCRAGGAPILLTTGVDELVDALNALPRADDSEVVCLAIEGPFSEKVLVLRYPDGGTTAVYVDYTCSSVTADGRIRFGDPVSVFRELHRAQLVGQTDPAAIATPRCPEELRPSPDSAPGEGTIDRYGVPYTDDPALPLPLAAATSCRYDRDGRLVESYEDRGDLTALRDAWNATFDDATLEHSSCASDVDTMGAAMPDMIRVADVTGGTAEAWLYSTAAGAPCPAGFSRAPGVQPRPELTAYLDRTLGPVQ